MLKLEELEIKDIKLIEFKNFQDHRGFFQQSYQYDEFSKIGIKNRFIQDNISLSKKNVLRGLHYQKKSPQAKLITVITGSIFDVAVDLRKRSPTFGKWVGKILSEENNAYIYIPRGFAHGFLSLENNTQVTYKCDNYYDAKDQYGIKWNDPEIKIDWPSECEVILSEKDKNLPFIKNIKEFF